MPAPRTEPVPVARSPRIDVNQAGLLVDSSGTEIPVTILDLSHAGFRLRSDEKLQVGERMRLRSGRHDEVAIEVRWTAGDQVGGVFLDAIKPPPA